VTHTLSLHDALPISFDAVAGAAARHRKEHREPRAGHGLRSVDVDLRHSVHKLREEAVSEAADRTAVTIGEHRDLLAAVVTGWRRSEEHTSELQSRGQ